MEKLPPTREIVEETLRDLDESVAKLEQELKELRDRRQTWAVILRSLLSLEGTDAGSAPAFDTEKERLGASAPGFRQSADRTAAAPEYGDFTTRMREYLIAAPESPTPRSAIVRYAREMGASSNFPYQFINRMIENGELKEPLKARYQPTEKMLVNAMLATDGTRWVEVKA